MNTGLDEHITSIFLESGQSLALTSHTAALVAGIGDASAHSTIPRIAFCGSLLCWLVERWFAARVAIDASLFRRLAGEPEDHWRRLDDLMGAWGFRRACGGRSNADRTRGAIALWRRQAVALAMQLAILIAAVILQAMGF
jgi:hypothetical protein